MCVHLCDDDDDDVREVGIEGNGGRNMTTMRKAVRRYISDASFHNIPPHQTHKHSCKRPTLVCLPCRNH